MSNIIQRVEQNCQEGNFYDAQQMIKSFYHRCTQKKEFERGLQLLLNGIRIMFKYKQVELACDLSTCVVELFEKAQYKIDDHPFTTGSMATLKTLDILQLILKSYPQEANKEKINYLQTAIKWTSSVLPQKKNSSMTIGHPSLHFNLALEYWKGKAYSQAHKHFARCSSPEEHAKLLFEWSKNGNPEEKDLFIARAVLQLLNIERIQESKILFKIYMDLHKNDSNFSGTPLTNFTKFLLLSIEKKNKDLFIMLRDKYSKAIERDPSFDKYVKGIASTYFGIRERENALSSMFNSLLQGFLS